MKFYLCAILILSGCAAHQERDSSTPRPAKTAGLDQARRSVDEERLNSSLERRDLQGPAEPWDAPRD